MAAPFVAVVTGSSSGIGRATAIAFAQKNAFVQLHGNSNLAGLCESARLTKSSTEASGACLVHVVDLTCSDSARAMMECAFAQFGYVDAWVNAAGADVLTGDARQRTFSQKLDALWKLAIPNATKLKINNGICHAVRHLLWRFLIGSVLFQSFILIKFEAIPRN